MTEGTILSNMDAVFKAVAIAESRQCSRCGCVRVTASQSWSDVCSCAGCERGCTLPTADPQNPGFPTMNLLKLLQDRVELDNLLLFSNCDTLPTELSAFLNEVRLDFLFCFVLQPHFSHTFMHTHTSDMHHILTF